MIAKLISNMHFLTAMVLFLIGFHTMLTHSNLIKKVMGMNIMETGYIFVFHLRGLCPGRQFAHCCSGGRRLYKSSAFGADPYRHSGQCQSYGLRSGADCQTV